VATYYTGYATYFVIDGDIKKDGELRGEGSKEYVLGWIREKLRKMENGQIKIVKDWQKRERDWEQEEKLRKDLWEDFETLYTTNQLPKKIRTQVHECPVVYAREIEAPRRSPSPTCKIS